MKSNLLSYAFVLGITCSGFGAISPQVIVDAAKAQKEKIHNFHCVVEYAEQDNTAIVVPLTKNDLPMLSRAQIDNMNARHSSKSYQRQELAYDDSGRNMESIELGAIDANGIKAKPRWKNIWVWDGITGTTYTQTNFNITPTATLYKDIPPGMGITRTPAKSFGGDFIHALEVALKEKRAITISESNDLTKMSFTDSELKSERTGYIDTQKGCSVIRVEVRNNGNLAATFTSTPKQMADGIWFPMEGTIETFAEQGVWRTISHVKVNDLTINDTAFNEKQLFILELPVGTQIVDTVTNTKWVIGDSNQR